MLNIHASLTCAFGCLVCSQTAHKILSQMLNLKSSAKHAEYSCQFNLCFWLPGLLSNRPQNTVSEFFKTCWRDNLRSLFKLAPMAFAKYRLLRDYASPPIHSTILAMDLILYIIVFGVRYPRFLARFQCYRQIFSVNIQALTICFSFSFPLEIYFY